MRSVQYLNLDINKKTQQVITANVGEIGSRYVKIKLIDNDKPLDLTGVSVFLYSVKSDDTKVFNTAEIEDAKNGIILAQITSQLMLTPGSIKLTLVLLSGDSKLGSKEFTLNVDDSILKDEVVESTNEFTALTTALTKVQGIDNKFANIDEQFNTIMNNDINGLKYITAKTLGIYPNMKEKEVEFSNILQSFLLEHANDYIIFFDKGTYYLSNINVNYIKDTVINLEGVATGNAVQDVKTIINTQGKDFIIDSTNGKNNRIIAKDIHFTSIGQNGRCFVNIGTSGEFNFKFTNVYIGNFDTGFKSPQWSCGGSGGEGISFYNNRTGAIMGLSSHLFYAKGLSLNHNRIGIDFRNGGNGATIEDVHIAIGYAGNDRDSFSEFIGIKTNGSLTINNLYVEDYVGGGAYQAYKHIAIDYQYAGYGLSPLICNNVNIQHGEGSKQDKTIRFKQIDASGIPQRFYTDKLIMNNLQSLDVTAIDIQSGFEQLGILINGENIFSDKSNTILFNRKEYSLENKDYILKKGYGVTIDTKTYNRIKLADSDILAKQCDVYYNKRINKDFIPIYSEYIKLNFTNTFLVKIKLNIFTTNNDEPFLICKLLDFDKYICDVKALKTVFGYSIDFEKILISETNSGFNYLSICLEGTSLVWGSDVDYKIDIKQIGSCRNS